jgi:hypothetical protein
MKKLEERIIFGTAGNGAMRRPNAPYNRFGRLF